MPRLSGRAAAPLRLLSDGAPTSVLQEATMTDGLVLLGAWVLFGLMLAVLAFFLLRGTR